jgi:hypothetical protein
MVVLRGMSTVMTLAQRLDAERKRRDVEQQDVAHVFAGQLAALDRRAERHDLVGVDRAVGLLAEDLLHERLDRGTRVEPPTRMTSSISLGARACVLEACEQGSRSARAGGSMSCSNLARLRFEVRCLGPDVRRDERQVDRGLLAPS